MTREAFEQKINLSPSYQKQLFIHGERLFIIENGQYKIAAIQLAWEIDQQQQKTIDEQSKELKQAYEDVDTFAKQAEIEANFKVQFAKQIDEQQKRIVELERKNSILSKTVQNQANGVGVMQLERNTYFHESEARQKRIDELEKAEFLLARVRLIISHGSHTLESIVLKSVEQALRGGQ